MATLNVGAMSARLGLDPAEFLDKMKGVQGFNGFVSGEMARQWKKTGRDGQEGLRLIDEALGIHVARPVARIVSETFPALGKAMSSILPGVAFSALGYAIFEFAEGISKKMDEAKKKQDEYTDAVLKTKAVAAQAAADSQKTYYGLEAKQAHLEGDTQGESRYKALEANAESAEKMARYVESLVSAERRELDASLALMPVWSALGRIWHEIWTSNPQLGIEKVGDEIKIFEQKFADLSLQDALKGTTTAAKYLNDQLDESQTKIDGMLRKQREAANMATSNEMGAVTGFEGVAYSAEAQGPSDKEINAERERRRHLQDIKDQADRDAKNAQLQATIDAKEAGMRHEEQLRSEIEAIQRLGATSTAAAASAELLAASTGKGTTASIQAAAAAEAQKKILDAQAEANTKLFAGTHQPVGQDKSVQAALADYAVLERRNALTEQAAKAVEEFNRKLGAQGTHDNERIAALEEEADAHDRVATAQARELATLVPLQQNLQQLKDLYASLPAADKRAPSIGPPATAAQGFAQQLARDISAAQSSLQGETEKINKVINPKIETAAFSEEMQKVKEEMASLSGAEISPWAKIDAEVKHLTTDLHLLPEQVAQLRQALTGLQNVKIGAEFEKLGIQIKEEQASFAALSSGSPFAKIDAEVIKLNRTLGATPAQLALIRDGLIAIQSAQNAGKAFEAADVLNAGGARMLELRQQMDALSRASATGRTDEGTPLSADAIAAVRLEMQNIAAEEDKILLKTGGISEGIKAWGDELQAIKSEGEDVFALLSQASKSFEDDAAKSVLNILDRQRDEHHKAIEELRKMWSGYFNSLAEMAMKQQLARLLAPLGKAITGPLSGNQQQAAPNLAPTAPGSLTGLGAFLPKPGVSVGSATLSTAGTMLQSAATQLEMAASALRSSAMSAGGAVSGSGIPGIGGGMIPFMAEGGDATPGSSFVSGESGAEQVDLDRSGGAHITPLGFSSAKSGDTVHYYDQRGAVVTDDLMRKADMARAMAHTKMQAVGEAVANMSEIQRRTPQAGR